MQTHDNSRIVTRMAPSPTGRFHIGGIRTAFYNYAFARKNGGKFILRIEDTDTERNSVEHEKEIYEVFDWIGMEYDEVIKQSENLPKHQEFLRKMIEQGLAYEGEEANDKTGNVIRFKNPNKIVTFQDQILGEISVDTTDLGDFIIARNINSPLYHLAVVIDDNDSGVTHVIRSQEHVADTPRQILLNEALGFNLPIYAHVPFILGPDGKKKLSKRDGNVAALDYKMNGYLPEALLNFLAFIGWNPGTDQEIFSKEELVSAFSLKQVQKGPGGFNLDKLNWINKQYLQKLSDDEFVSYLGERLEHIKQLPGYQEDIFKKIIPQLRERAETLLDVDMMIENGEVGFYFISPEYDIEKAVWKEDDKNLTKQYLEYLISLIENYTGEWKAGKLKEVIFPFAEEKGKGSVLWPLRYSLSGRDKSPDPFSLLEILGKQESTQRITKAVEML